MRLTMDTYDIIPLSTHPEWRISAARWFHKKWDIPLEEYLESIDESIRETAPIPQWYVIVEGQRIIAGAGVIENDFHNRKDLTPNVCALFVEPERRCQGIAGKLLEHICMKMAEKGIATLYLITEHTSFYERYGWEFLCMVQDDDGEPMRMYQKATIMNLQIRLEQPEDYCETEQVTREAFWNHYSPGCMEHYLLHIMRSSPNFVPELDFVAVADGQIIGNIAFMKSFILGDDGKRYEVLSMGPISVLPAFQRNGVGRMLIEHARAVAKEAGYRAILLCDDPSYYTKVGFTAAEHFGIRTSENKYFAALHVCPLHADALNGVTGRYFEDEIYNVDEAAVKAFDAHFPPKERLSGTPMQRRFAEVFAMQRDYTA